VNVPEVTPAEAREWLAAENAPRLIDVREREEWEICHLNGAELIPLSVFAESFRETLNDPTAKLLVYCHHGVRSAHAAQFLKHHGFTDVVNLAGGIDAWSVEVDPAVRRY
jgi:sulfur-carrier protein adenylyltransferase/sulfurtransferase